MPTGSVPHAVLGGEFARNALFFYVQGLQPFAFKKIFVCGYSWVETSRGLPQNFSWYLKKPFFLSFFKNILEGNRLPFATASTLSSTFLAKVPRDNQVPPPPPVIGLHLPAVLYYPSLIC
jgi:hypothetical protein